MSGNIVALTLVGVLGCSSGAATQSSTAPAPSRKSLPPPAKVVPDGPMSETSLMADVNWLCAAERKGRGSYQQGGLDAAAWLKSQFSQAGLQVVERPIKVGRFGGNAVNIFGVHKGDDRVVIVSAHYDHLGIDNKGKVYPGADDNASGVAVMLAMARYAAKNRYQHTILFAGFGAEEAGLVGSLAYVRTPLRPLDKTIGVINFDMVGRRFFEATADRDGAVAVIGLELDSGVARATEAAAASAGLALVAMPARMVSVFGFEFRTDEWWFRRRGMLAVHFTTGFHTDYHQTSDTPDKLVPGQMRRIARTAAGLMDYLAKRSRT